MFKKIIVSVLLLCFVFAGTVTASASVTDSFIRNDTVGGQTTVSAREMYTVSKTVTAASLGIEEALQGLTDIYCAKDGTVYVLCGEKSRLVVLNGDYTFNRELDITDEGGSVDFTGAAGVFVDKNNNIYCRFAKCACFGVRQRRHCK